MSGYIQIYCGDGKGKTTAAVGLAIRGVGAGVPVVFTQFMKDGTSSELVVLEQIQNIQVLYAKETFGFSWTLTEKEKADAKSVYTELFVRAIQEVDKLIEDRTKEILKGDITIPKVILVLDEIISAYNYNMIDQDIVLKWLQNKSEFVEVVLTGREPKKELLELAGYITEMKKGRHIYEEGVMARKGIEY